MHAVHGSNICYLASYAYLWSPMIYLVSWSPMLICLVRFGLPGLLGLSGLLGLPVVSYAYLCGRLPVVSYAYTLLPRPTWSPICLPGLLSLPACGLLCLPSLLGLPIVSYAYLCGLLCLPSFLSLLIVS